MLPLATKNIYELIQLVLNFDIFTYCTPVVFCFKIILIFSVGHLPESFVTNNDKQTYTDTLTVVSYNTCEDQKPISVLEQKSIRSKYYCNNKLSFCSKSDKK